LTERVAEFRNEKAVLTNDVIVAIVVCQLLLCHDFIVDRKTVRS
jgi:hypothetical protein